MTPNDVGEDIRFIREMLERTKTLTAQSWKYFYVWGVVIILAIIGSYVLAYLDLFRFIWVNWMGFSVIGAIISGYLGSKEGKRGVTTYAQKVVISICYACGAGFILVAFVFPIMKVYDFGVIPILTSMVAGILVFSLGGVYRSGFLFFAGGLWWLGAFVMCFLPADYRPLISILLLIGGYLIPGYMLSRKYKKETENHG